jgi:hypothetical protein
LLALELPAFWNGRQGVSARPRVAHYIQNLHLVSVLDELRDAYELCKEEGHPKMQLLLLQIRRRLLQALHESLNLYGENAELHQQLSEALAEIKQLRERAAHSAGKADAAQSPRKLS